MELPFLKKKNNLGSVIVEEVRDSDKSSDDMLLESISQELLDAIHKKDIKSIKEALRAILEMMKE